MKTTRAKEVEQILMPLKNKLNKSGVETRTAKSHVHFLAFDINGQLYHAFVERNRITIMTNNGVVDNNLSAEEAFQVIKKEVKSNEVA